MGWSKNHETFYDRIGLHRSDFVVGVVVKTSVTPVQALALQSKVKEKQAQHGELLQHARTERQCFGSGRPEIV